MSSIMRAVIVSALFASALALPTTSCTKHHHSITATPVASSTQTTPEAATNTSLHCNKKKHSSAPIEATSLDVVSSFSTSGAPTATHTPSNKASSPRQTTSTSSTGSNSSRADTSSCFPYGSATLPSDYSAPSTPQSSWWCPAAQQYGFQGFSYPLEDADCSASSNSFEAMSKDFGQMKRDFGASIVRVYYPGCTQASVFENLVRAAVANNMAVIPQIWFGFDGDDSVWKASRDALYSVMESERYGKIAPYVFHSADFGSEPVGDGVDGDNFVSDLRAFKAKMNAYGVPAGISEDWDRPGTMSGSDGSGLGDTGTQIKAASDFVHAHIMPYYHGNVQESTTWDYISKQIDYLTSTVQLPTFITETQWAWGENSHFGGHVDVGVDQYTAYWKKFDDECELMKEKKIGWFVHDWRGEETFDMVKSEGGYVIDGWKPRRC